jgi:hypothetical protein
VSRTSGNNTLLDQTTDKKFRNTLWKALSPKDHVFFIIQIPFYTRNASNLTMAGQKSTPAASSSKKKAAPAASPVTSQATSRKRKNPVFEEESSDDELSTVNPSGPPSRQSSRQPSMPRQAAETPARRLSQKSKVFLHFLI